MNIRMTKEDYKLLIRLIVEGQNSILIKKAYGIKTPEQYNIDKYIMLYDKIIMQGQGQKISEEEIEMAINNEDMEELESKMEKETIRTKEITNQRFIDLTQGEYGKIIFTNFFENL